MRSNTFMSWKNRPTQPMISPHSWQQNDGYGRSGL
jgi:hypothetical protein